MIQPNQKHEEKMAELIQSIGLLKTRNSRLESQNQTRHVSLPPDLRNAPMDVALGRLRKFNPMEAATIQIKAQQRTIDAQEPTITELRQSTLELRQAVLDIRQAESRRDSRVQNLEEESEEKDERIEALGNETDHLLEGIKSTARMAYAHETSLRAMGYAPAPALEKCLCKHTPNCFKDE